MAAAIGEVFSPVGEFKKEIMNGLLLSCSVNPDERRLTGCCSFDTYIRRNDLLMFSEAVRSRLSLDSVKFSYVFPKTAYCPAAAEDIAAELRAENAMLNGYFNKAVFEVTDGKEPLSVTNVTLKFGGMETLKACNFEREFLQRVHDRFSIDGELAFDGQLDDVTMERPEIKQEPIVNKAAVPQPVQKPAAPAAPARVQAPKKVTGLNIPPTAGIIADTAEQVYGKKLTGNLIELSNLTPDEGESLVWGEIFFSEIVATKSGKGYRVKFQMYDGTNSVTVKMVTGNNQFDILSGALKKGNCVILHGVYKMDDWEKDYCLEPDGKYAILDFYKVHHSAYRAEKYASNGQEQRQHIIGMHYHPCTYENARYNGHYRPKVGKFSFSRFYTVFHH